MQSTLRDFTAQVTDWEVEQKTFLQKMGSQNPSPIAWPLQMNPIDKPFGNIVYFQTYSIFFLFFFSTIWKQ